MWETGNILNITFSGSVCSAHQAPLKPESWHVGVHAYPLLYRVNRLFSWMCLGPVYPLATSVVARVIARVSRLRFRPLFPHTAAAGVLCVRCRTHGGCMHFRLDTSLKTFLRGLGGEDVGRDVRSRSGRKTSLGPPACPNRPSACNRSHNKRNGSGRPSVLKITGEE